MEQTIDVRIRAQTAELKSGMDEAACQTQATAQKMQQSFVQASTHFKQIAQQLNTQVTAVGSTLHRTMKTAAESVQGSLIAMSGHFSGLLNVLSRLPGGFALVGIAAATITFKKGIDETAQMTENALDLGRALGISATAAQTFNVLLADLGASQSELEGVSRGMVRQLKTNENAMRAIGLQTRDTTGQLRPMNVLLTEGISLLQNYKTGVDRNLAAQTLFGRGLDASSKLLLMTQEKYQETERYAQSLGLTVGQQSVAAWQAFDEATDKANMGIQGLFKAIGDQLMPTLTVLIEALNTVLPTAIQILKGLLAELATAFEAVRFVAKRVWQAIAAMYQSTTTIITRLSYAMHCAIVGDFKGAARAIQDTGTHLSAIWRKNLDAIENDAYNTFRRIKNLWSNDTSIPEPHAAMGKHYRSFRDDKGGEKDAAGGGLVSAWEGELERMKLTFQEMKNQAGQFQDDAMEQEKQFWQSKLALTHQGSAANIAVRKKLAELTQALHQQAFEAEMAQLKQQEMATQNNAKQQLAIVDKEVALTIKAYGKGTKAYAQIEAKRIAIAQKVAEQIQAIHCQTMEAENRYRYAQIDAAQSVAQSAFAIQTISQAELLALEMRYENERYAIKQQWATMRMGLLDPDKDPVKYAEEAQVIEQIELDHQAKLRHLKQQLEQETQKPEIAVFSQMQTGFQEALLNMMTHAQNLKTMLTNLFQSIYKVFLQEMCIKPLADSAARFAREQILHRTMAALQVGAQASASAGVAAIKTAEAHQVVAANAAEAGSGAAASQAAIPIVGPSLGMAAAIAMFAFAMGFIGKGGSRATTTTREIPSAAGGFDIPSGLNPVTKLHEKEMVLPAEHADTIRNLKGANVAFEALNFHITSMDARGVKSFLLDNKMALVDALKSALRDFKT